MPVVSCFFFWSITRLVRALLVGDERKLSVMDVIIILGAGFVGALAYTFSDTFWFSAVEGRYMPSLLSSQPWYFDDSSLAG